MSFRQSIEQRMKHLMVVLTGLMLMLGSCQEETVLVDDEAVGQEARQAIGFDQTFIDHAFATRAGAPVALSDYATTMGVWGWRSDAEVTDQPQFIDQLVTYNTTAAKWQYSPLRYWERNSIYRFYAYAPHQTETNATVTIDAVTGHIAISDVTLAGTNLQDPSTTAQQYVFSTVALGDIDWMIARAGKTNLPGRFGQTVDFTMQHILSKLNVAVRINDVLAADAGLTAVTVDSLLIRPFIAQGDFAQVLDHTPDATLASDRTAGEWTLTAAPSLTLRSAQNVSVTRTLLYIMESLVLPQDIDLQTVKLCYTLTFSDGRTERYTYQMPLTDAFGPTTEAGGQFLSGYSYTLNFVIGPDVIAFDSGVDGWTNSIDVTKQVP